MLDYGGCVHGLIAAEAGGTADVVRVPVNEPSWIGRALDAGAQAVIVPLVNSAEETAAAARACLPVPAQQGAQLRADALVPADRPAAAGGRGGGDVGLHPQP